MISATKMAQRLRQLSSLLMNEDLIESDSVSAFQRAASALDGQKLNPSWKYSITQTDPIRFCPVNTKKVKHVRPILQVKLGVNPIQNLSNGMKGYFSELNTTLELYSESDELLDRWHVDLSNEDQEGPVFHLQHGGHSSGSSTRNTEEKLSVPRWVHPPMDIVLTCELVVANFFQKKWLELRENPTWTALVRDAESYCYTDYVKFFDTHYSDQSRKETMLHKFWT